MCYKTIVVNAQAARRARHIADCASRIAVGQQAHLVGLASTGIGELAYQSNAVAPGVPLLPEELAALTGVARRALACFTANAARHGVLSSEERLTDDNLSDSLALQSRYCDLLVVGQADASDLASDGVVLPQQLILRSPRPVLVVPSEGAVDRVGERMLLAWDGGMAASRAIEAALPLLRRAARVTLAVFNPSQVYGAHGELPGADMARYLARHGVGPDVVVRDTAAAVGDALLSLAREIDADLLVMGCYGHTRLRELLIGGVTRDILNKMTLPVLMAG